MVEVFVAPSRDAGRAAREIACLLSRHRPTALLLGGLYRRAGGSPDFLVLGDPPTRIETECGLLVVGEGAQTLPRIKGMSALLLCGPWPGAVPKLTGAQLISCGLGGRDTISVSSLTHEQAVVSLLRPVTTLSGRVAGPCELLLPLPPGVDLRSVLAAAGVLVLAGLLAVDG